MGGLIFDAAGNLYGMTSTAAMMTEERCLSFRLMGMGAGRKRFCIASTDL